MTKRKTIDIIVPAASTAVKNRDYFEIYKQIFKANTILRLIIVYPMCNPQIFVNAAAGYADTKIIVTPYAVQNPYYGHSELKEVIQRLVPILAKDNPDEIVIITSGGTTKMGHMVSLVGNISSQFGWEVFYYWVAKSPTKSDFVVTKLPEVICEYTDDFSVIFLEEKNTILVKGNINVNRR